MDNSKWWTAATVLVVFTLIIGLLMTRHPVIMAKDQATPTQVETPAPKVETPRKHERKRKATRKDRKRSSPRAHEPRTSHETVVDCDTVRRYAERMSPAQVEAARRKATEEQVRKVKECFR